MREGPGSNYPVVYNISYGHYIAMTSGPPFYFGCCCLSGLIDAMPGMVINISLQRCAVAVPPWFSFYGGEGARYMPFGEISTSSSFS